MHEQRILELVALPVGARRAAGGDFETRTRVAWPGVIRPSDRPGPRDFGMSCVLTPKPNSIARFPYCRAET